MQNVGSTMARGMERLSNGEFIELIPHLRVDELLPIEYFITSWKFLVTVASMARNTYNCTLCQNLHFGHRNLAAHIEGKKHRSRLKTVKQLYHPSYTYDKENFNGNEAKPQPAATVKKVANTKPQNTSLSAQTTGAKVIPSTQPSYKNKLAAETSQSLAKNCAANTEVEAATMCTAAANKSSSNEATLSTPQAAGKTISLITSPNSSQIVPANVSNVTQAAAKTLTSVASISASTKSPAAVISTATSPNPIKDKAATTSTVAANESTSNETPVLQAPKKKISLITLPNSSHTVPANKSNVTQAAAKTLTSVASISASTKSPAAVISTATSPNPIKDKAATTSTVAANESTSNETPVLQAPKKKISLITLPNSSHTVPANKSNVTQAAARSQAATSTTTASTLQHNPFAAKAKHLAQPCNKTGPMKSTSQPVANNNAEKTKFKAATISTAEASNSTLSEAALQTPQTAGEMSSDIKSTNASQAVPANNVNVTQAATRSPAKGVPNASNASPITQSSYKAGLAASTSQSPSKNSAEIKAAAKTATTSTATTNESTSDKATLSTPEVSGEKSCDGKTANALQATGANNVNATQTATIIPAAVVSTAESTLQFIPFAAKSDTPEQVATAGSSQPVSINSAKETDDEIATTSKVAIERIAKEASQAQNDKMELQHIEVVNIKNTTVAKPKITVRRLESLLNPVEIQKTNSTTAMRHMFTAESDDFSATKEMPMVNDSFVLNPYALKRQRTAFSQASATEVIVIDDESVTNESSQISVSDSHTTEENDGEEPSAKRVKVFINPAITNTNSTHYTSNIVRKIPVTSTSSNAGIGEPTFSHKTFSCKTKDSAILGFLGIEYVIKIVNNQKQVRYECGLCEIVLVGYAMQNHILGYGHRLKYCERHFPSAIRQYRVYMGDLPEHEVFKVMAPILDTLAIAIEEYHGRSLPLETLENDYTLNRFETLTKVFSLRHPNEQNGSSFTHLLDSAQVDELVIQRHKYMCRQPSRTTFFDAMAGPISNNSAKHTRTAQRDHHSTLGSSADVNSRLAEPRMSLYSDGARAIEHRWNRPVDDETHKQMVESFLRETKRSSREKDMRKSRSKQRTRSRSNHRTRSRSNDRTRSHSNDRTRSRSPLRGTCRRKSISPLRDNDIWQAYRHMVDQKIANLEIVFRKYRQNPETHPLYHAEWLKFWKRRKSELIAAGLDHRTYNYQPEWVRFCHVRMEELFTEEAENIKINCRERLYLPMTNESVSDPNYYVAVGKLPLARMGIEPPIQTGLGAKTKYDHAIDDNQSSKVVAVLRLMTALEDQLGSMGPKIIALMANALQVEKSAPDQINRIILTKDNCFLLETAMEKFKGLIIAGLLEGCKERALRKAVAEVQALLDIAETEHAKVNHSAKTVLLTTESGHNAEAAARPNKKPTLDSPLSNSLDINKLENCDKKEIAAKLAAVLTAQGKTDFDQEHLQQLIAIYTLIEKEKRESSAKQDSTEAQHSSRNSTPQRSLTDILSTMQRNLLNNQTDNTNAPKSCGQNNTNNNNTIQNENRNSKHNINNNSETKNRNKRPSIAIPNTSDAMNGGRGLSGPWSNPNYHSNQNASMHTASNYSTMPYSNFMPNVPNGMGMGHWQSNPQQTMHNVNFNAGMGYPIAGNGFNSGFIPNIPNYRAPLHARDNSYNTATASYSSNNGANNYINNNRGSNNYNQYNRVAKNNNNNNNNVGVLNQGYQMSSNNYAQQQRSKRRPTNAGSSHNMDSYRSAWMVQREREANNN